MAQVIITISPNGQSKVEVKGARGSGCKDLTRGIEDALGKTTADEKTADFHRQAMTINRQEIRQ